MMPQLPVESVIGEIRAALESPGSAVVVAPPGSGKTTVVPLRLLDEGWSTTGRLVMLEPRRLAARAAARRMASTMGEEVGETIGYVTRDDRRTGPDTRIEVVTEGILTRRIQNDPGLEGVAAVIFDEVHERNLQTDLGLALVLDSRRSIRPDLRLLLMSATIDAARLAGHLDPRAPVISAEARTHPVDVRWSPAPRNSRMADHVASVVRTALRSEPGDVLVFLPGMGDIRRVAERLGDEVDAEVLILHGSLPPADQDRALAPSHRRKVVLSTDIAETSLTVEGVRVVIDSGLARAPRHDVRTGMTRLETISISKASADQRAGRAGRTEPGVAYRLWSKIEHGARRPHGDPEITQVDLAGLMLELAAWGTTDPTTLPFLDRPPGRAVEEALRLLEALGAVDDRGRITETGRRMAGLPVHPRLARMIVGAGDDRRLACLLAALVEERDILRGHPDELPVDLSVRVSILAGIARHPAASGGIVQRVRRTADDLARRAGGPDGDAPDPGRAGPVLATAYPDRLAVRRGSPGRFQLRTGTTAWCNASDPLAAERFLVAADLDGRRRDARIRLAAAIDADEVAAAFADQVERSRELVWEGDRLVERTTRRLGGLVLATDDRRPGSGDETAETLRRRLRRDGVGALSWSPKATALRSRMAFASAAEPGFPDVSDDALISDVDSWLGPELMSATGWDDLVGADLERALGRLLDHERRARLETVAPGSITLPGGRRAPIDYGGGTPTLSVRVQEVFGWDATPVLGGRRLVLDLLSPAGRTIQITGDLQGFWSGSWQEVRRHMAGRYPKHAWPEDPRRPQE